MHYRSALETLEGFSNALARHCTHQVVAWAILYALVKVREIAHGSEQGAWFTLL